VLSAFGLPWALISAGVVLTVLSALAQFRSHPRPLRRARTPLAVVPGPSHPGTVHIAGGK
jgi:hypothetical protein